MTGKNIGYYSPSIGKNTRKRTSAGIEVDFIIPGIENPKALEAKFDESAIKPNKYKVFKEAYPDIRLDFVWINPFGDDFFRPTSMEL